MCIFWQSVHHGHYGRFPLWTRQTRNEIHGDFFKYHVRHRQRLQQACRVFKQVFHLLTHLARGYKIRASLRIAFQNKLENRQWNVRETPACPPTGEEWSSSSNFSLKEESEGKTRRPLNRSSPSLTYNSAVELLLNFTYFWRSRSSELVWFAACNSVIMSNCCPEIAKNEASGIRNKASTATLCFSGL